MKISKEICLQILHEDRAREDITSLATIEVGARGDFAVTARREMVVCGVDSVGCLISHGGFDVEYTACAGEGDIIAEGAIIARISGNVRDIMAAERSMLNILQHMSGVATATAAYVAKAKEGGDAVVLDTRKTLPLMRDMQKYAVRMGGGHNHRRDLGSGILIKDNHIHAAGGVARVLFAAREYVRMHDLRSDGKGFYGEKGQKMPIEIECDTQGQALEAVQNGADIILLDNMLSARMKGLVAQLRAVNPQVMIEASGGVGLDNIGEISASGVDAISIGALTHSVVAMDIGLDGV